MAGNGYEKEFNYIRSHLSSNKTIAESNPHVATVRKAAERGYGPAKEFVEAYKLDPNKSDHRLH